MSGSRQTVGLLGVRTKRLVTKAGTKSHKAFVKRALGFAIAAGQKTNRPIGAEDQPILAEAFRGMLHRRE